MKVKIKFSTGAQSSDAKNAFNSGHYFDVRNNEGKVVANYCGTENVFIKDGNETKISSIEELEATVKGLGESIEFRVNE